MNSKNKAIIWQEKQHILFNLDTLLDYSAEQYFWSELLPKAYSSRKQLSLEQAKLFIQSELAEQNGTLNFYCIDYWQAKLGVDVLLLQQQHASQLKFKPYAEKFLFYLDNLKSEHKFKMHVISNEHPKALDVKIRATGLDCFFDKIESSYSYGFLRESKEFWHKYLVNSKIATSSAILFDDNYTVLHNALTSGLKVVAVNKLMEQLDQNNLSGVTQIDNFGALLPLKINNADIDYV